MSNKLEDYGKSLELAAQIQAMKPIIMEMDLQHLEHAIKTFDDQASFQDSAAVLNLRYNPEKSDLLRTQVATMRSLLAFINGLKLCDELKKKIAEHDANREQIEKLFW